MFGKKLRDELRDLRNYYNLYVTHTDRLIDRVRELEFAVDELQSGLERANNRIYNRTTVRYGDGHACTANEAITAILVSDDLVIKRLPSRPVEIEVVPK